MLRRSPLLLAQTRHEAALYEELGGRARGDPAAAAAAAAGRAAAHRQGRFVRGSGSARASALLLFLGRDQPAERARRPDRGGRAAARTRYDRSPSSVETTANSPSCEARFARLFADGRVRFAGPLYGDERFDAYADADVFCLTPPHWEETSVASLEAAASGTAVVVTEQAELPGLSTRDRRLRRPARPGAIREAVEAALADRGHGRARAASRARAARARRRRRASSSATCWRSLSGRRPTSAISASVWSAESGRLRIRSLSSSATGKPPATSELAVSGLAMDGRRVVDRGPDSALLERGRKRLALLTARRRGGRRGRRPAASTGRDERRPAQSLRRRSARARDAARSPHRDAAAWRRAPRPASRRAGC